jgi:hypothetical protein
MICILCKFLVLGDQIATALRALNFFLFYNNKFPSLAKFVRCSHLSTVIGSKGTAMALSWMLGHDCGWQQRTN